MDLGTAVTALDGARERSLGLLEPLPEELLLRQVSPIMSPLVWDLAHVGNYEELWLLRALGAEGVRPDLDEVYDAFRHPRRERSSLSILGPPEARSYVAEVRERVLNHLDADVAPLAVEAEGAPDRRGQGGAARILDRPRSAGLLEDGFVYGMVVQHEHQHVETMLATLQLGGSPVPLVGPAGRPAGRPVRPSEVHVEEGPFVMGTDDEGWAYDNERPARTVDLPGFFIDSAPVSNHDYLAFVEAGGYDEARLWDRRGWSWRQQSGAAHPANWERDGEGGFTLRRFGRQERLAPDEPVQHVCWYEADAFARFAGKRLPTEAEWEKAASWTREGTKRRYPWGNEAPDEARANLGQRLVGPAPVGAFPQGTSPWGCEQMLGDVWEWTASDFEGHPGFSAFPYREYSEVFFGTDYKVLRGGSWATHPLAVRATFRNWDFPVRRQIFAGFRCARDE